MGTRPMRIAELARQAGVSTATLRYYEEQGLLRPTRRTEAGYRVYGQDVLYRVGFIQRAKTLGLSLRQIQQLPTMSLMGATGMPACGTRWCTSSRTQIVAFVSSRHCGSNYATSWLA